MKPEKSLFIIKPEALNIRDDIKKYIIKNSPLKIIESKIVVLNNDDIELIYIDDIGTNLLTAAKTHLVNKEVEVCIVEGYSAVNILWDLTGRNFDGEKCGIDTLRYIFGRMGTVKYGDVTYYLNAIHKTTPYEVKSALSWYYSK